VALSVVSHRLWLTTAWRLRRLEQREWVVFVAGPIDDHTVGGFEWEFAEFRLRYVTARDNLDASTR